MMSSSSGAAPAEGPWLAPWRPPANASFQPQIHYFVGGATKMCGGALYRLRREDFRELREYDGISPAWPSS